MIRARISTLLVLGLVLTAFQNCAKASFNEASATASSTCAAQLQTLKVPVKLLFVVDTSGSNAPDVGYSGTDPVKAVRGGSIQQFFSTYQSHSNFSWGFLTFNGSSARSLIGNPSVPNFTTSAATMQAAISSFYNVTDTDLTPYQAALQLATQTIADDTLSTTQTKYIVVFLSDGLPDPDVSDAVLHANIQTMLSLHPGQVTFNTIYYGAYDAVASARLSAMAAAGNGKFTNGQSFAITDVSTIAGTNCK